VAGERTASVEVVDQLVGERSPVVHAAGHDPLQDLLVADVGDDGADHRK
jgi:hypothetical protein